MNDRLSLLLLELKIRLYKLVFNLIFLIIQIFLFLPMLLSSNVFFFYYQIIMYDITDDEFQD